MPNAGRPLESAEKSRVLVCAYTEVPGPASAAVRVEQLLLAFSAGLDMDALTLKGPNHAHIQRVGQARMMRVPVPDAVVGERTSARTAFAERLGAYQRALVRQLESDAYDAVIALDLFSASTVVPVLRRARLIIEVSQIPSQLFERRYPVRASDDELRTSWELGERAAFKAATMVMAPSRVAARFLADRLDPRLVRVSPRLVDTRRCSPPSMELDLGTRTVAFLGGRDGKAAAVVVAAAAAILAKGDPDLQLLVLGAPSSHDARLRTELEKRRLADRVSLVDVSSPDALSQVLAGVDVVVVTGRETDWATPHRALEAMACGRATVVAASEAVVRDHIQPEHHARVVPPEDAAAIAAAVVSLLEDQPTRQRLARVGLRQAQRFDLDARLSELGSLLSEVTGLAFKPALPPIEEEAPKAPQARPPPSSPPLVTSSGEGLRPAEDQAAKVHDVKAPVANAGPSGSSPLTEATEDHRALRTSSAVPLSVMRGISSASGDGADVWAGDTMLDPNALLQPSDPAPAAVRGAMLVTQSGSAVKRRVAATATVADAEENLPAAGPTIDGSESLEHNPALDEATRHDADDVDDVDSTHRQPRKGTPVARSLRVPSSMSVDDDWSRDTIADASPVGERSRGRSASAPATHPPRSLLVEGGIGDLTAEDDQLPAHRGSFSSDKDQD